MSSARPHSRTVTTPQNKSETQLSEMSLADLKHHAEEVGVKLPGVGWPKCCPPKGNKADIVEALLLHRTSAGAAGEEVLIAKEEPLVKEEEPLVKEEEPVLADAFAFDHAADPFAAWIHAHELSGKWSLPPKPLITVSYRGKDVFEKGMSADPYGICDYIRDRNLWRSNSIFIDQEAFGYSKYWRELFHWAQWHSQAMLFFVSNDWTASDYCKLELKFCLEALDGVNGELKEHRFEIDDPKLAGAPPEVVRNLVISGVAGPCSLKYIKFVILEKGQIQSVRSLVRDLRDNLGLERSCYSRIEAYDLTSYWEFVRTKTKTSLKECSKGIQRLANDLRVELGEGTYEEFTTDFEECVRCPPVGFDGSEIRNRFFATHNCRIDLNSATSDQLAANVPGLGDTVSTRIEQARRESGHFTSLTDLLEIDGVGKQKIEDMMPFVRLQPVPQWQQQLIEDDQLKFTKSGTVDRRCSAFKRGLVDRDGNRL